MNNYYFKISNRKQEIIVVDFEINLDAYGEGSKFKYYVVPLTTEQIAFYEANPTASAYEVRNCQMNVTPEPTVEDIRNRKIDDIEIYDSSDNVNGFYYDGIFMWLDKSTRVGLVNMLNSAELLGQETVQIWYEQYNLTLSIQEARLFLAALEMYAAQCYNVTELHKRTVMHLETIEDIENYDITTGYPEQLHFESQNQ